MAAAAGKLLLKGLLHAKESLAAATAVGETQVKQDLGYEIWNIVPATVHGRSSSRGRTPTRNGGEGLRCGDCL